MKTKIINLFMLLALINFAGAKAIATEAEAEFDCQNKTIVEYVPAANWSNLKNVLPKHTAFMAEHLKNGNISLAGPLLSDLGVVGGLSIYNLTDKQKVEDIAKMDPFVTEGISTIVIKPWAQCVLK